MIVHRLASETIFGPSVHGEVTDVRDSVGWSR